MLSAKAQTLFAAVREALDEVRRDEALLTPRGRLYARMKLREASAALEAYIAELERVAAPCKHGPPEPCYACDWA